MRTRQVQFGAELPRRDVGPDLVWEEFPKDRIDLRGSEGFWDPQLGREPAKFLDPRARSRHIPHPEPPALLDALAESLACQTREELRDAHRHERRRQGDAPSQPHPVRQRWLGAAPGRWVADRGLPLLLAEGRGLHLLDWLGRPPHQAGRESSGTLRGRAGTGSGRCPAGYAADQCGKRCSSRETRTGRPGTGLDHAVTNLCPAATLPRAQP